MLNVHTFLTSTEGNYVFIHCVHSSAQITAILNYVIIHCVHSLAQITAILNYVIILCVHSSAQITAILNQQPSGQVKKQHNVQNTNNKAQMQHKFSKQIAIN
jgi:ribosomal silencing factor RsfS